MKRVDVFYTDEDGHRVRPLIRFLELQDLHVQRHTAPSAGQSAPYLVIVSEHYTAAPWLVELTSAADAIAVLLVDAALADSVRTLDLRAWPARSADRALASLAEWMKSPSARISPVSTGGARKQGSHNSQTQNRGALVVLALVVALLVWLATLSPDPEEQETEAATDRIAANASQTIASGSPTERAAPHATPPTDTPTALPTDTDPTPPAALHTPLATHTGLAGAPAYAVLRDAARRREVCQRLWALDPAGPQCWAVQDRLSWDPRYRPEERSPAA